MLRGIEVVQVTELITEGVADAAIRLRDLFDALLADGDVVSEILRCHPQPDDVRSVVADVRLGSLRLGIAALLFAFGNLLAIGIDHEAVGQYVAVRRNAVAGERQEQRRLKPAAMLVAALEVIVGLPRVGRASLGTRTAQLSALHQYGTRRRTGVDPHVKRVGGFANRLGAVPVVRLDRSPQVGQLALKPDIGAMLLHEISGVAHDACVENWLAL